MPFFAVFNPTWTHESFMWEEKTPQVTFDPNAVEVPPYYPDTPEVRVALATATPTWKGATPAWASCSSNCGPTD